MAGLKLVQLRLIFKKRRQTLNLAQFSPNKIFQALAELFNCREVEILSRITGKLALGTKSRTAGNKKLRILRHNNFIFLKLKGFNKAVAQLVHKVKRTTQKGNVTANRLTAGKTRNSLVYNRLINRSRNIFLAGTLVNQRLNISFCKYTTAGRNRINLLSVFRKLVQTVGISFKQSRHLIDKSTRTACTGTVHSLLNAAFKICNLSVFTAKLNYNISLGNNFLNSRSSRNNFLNKRNVKPVRNRKTARTSNLNSQSLIFASLKFLFYIV